MAEWSLSQLLSSLHEDIQHRLSTARKSFKHPGTKGDASEAIWIDMLAQYLPERYQVASAHVVYSTGNFSDQIDAVVFDRQYSPFIFTYEKQLIVPAESVYAVFEAKQTADANLVKYAQDKVASVRSLHRTSLPIPHAGGVYPGLCCTNGVKDSLFESSMIAGGHEQLDPDEVQDHELVGLQ